MTLFRQAPPRTQTAAEPRDSPGQSRRAPRFRKYWLGALGIVILFAGWDAISAAYNLSTLLPTPWTVLQTLFRALTLQEDSWKYGSNIYVHTGTSLLRGLIGLGISAGAAIPLGLLIGRVPIIREIADPVIKAIYPIPGIAWIPLAILWFGLGAHAIIFIVIIGCFFPILYSVSDGAARVDPILVDAARCYGAKGFRLFRRCVLPATVPALVTGLRIAVAESWRGVVAGEIVAGQTGIGWVLNEARFYFRAQDLLAAMIVIGCVGYTTERVVVGTVERHALKPWSNSN